MKNFLFFAGLLISTLIFFQTASFSQWVSLEGPAPPVYDLAVSDTNLYAGGATCIYLSTNNGASWSTIFSSEDYIVYTLLISGTDLFAGTYCSETYPDGGVFLLTRNSADWTNISQGLPKASVTALALIDTHLFAAGDSGVFHSTNYGTSWNVSNSGLTSHNITTLDVSGKNLFAGTDIGIFLSTDNGSSWTEADSGLTSPFVYSIFVSDTNIFAGTRYGGVFLSINNGYTWSAANSGMPINVSIYDFTVYDKNIYAAGDSGVFRSTNNGFSWTNVSDGLPTKGFFSSREVYSLDVCGLDLFAGTAMNKIYRRPLSELVTSSEESFFQVQGSYNLLQNYPNPFNPSTNFEYRIAEPALVSLKVFDVLGREVAEIVSEELKAGKYIRKWNAGNLAAGVYFYRLQAGSFSQTKKLMLLK